VIELIQLQSVEKNVKRAEKWLESFRKHNSCNTAQGHFTFWTKIIS